MIVKTRAHERRQRKKKLEFVKEPGKRGKGNFPIDGTMEIMKFKASDGKDGVVVDADEFSLEELMGNDEATSRSRMSYELLFHLLVRALVSWKTIKMSNIDQ